MKLIKCLAENDAYELIEMEGETSLSMAMEGASIRSLSKILTKKDIVKSISFFIGRFNQNFNASGKFTDIQLATVSMDLYDIFQYESLEDVMLMFKYARQGKIGDGKDFKLDSQTVFHKWVPQYLELKSIERENQHRKNMGEKNGIANFKWKPEDVNKLKLSDKTETVKQGLGSRVKEVIDTPEDYKPPIQKRSVYLGLLKASANKASRAELESSRANLIEKGSEPDALEVIENEMKNRGIL
jgi:hypothetical protein